MDGHETTSAINMTPMIDVMMALLIIFMVVTPVVTNYSARLPEAANVKPEPGDDVVTLGIDRDGALWVGDTRVTMAGLADDLRMIYAGRPGDHLLYLRADRDVEYSLVLNALSAAQQAGVRTVGAISMPVAASDAEEHSPVAESPEVVIGVQQTRDPGR